jgi:hypothetical protein
MTQEDERIKAIRDVCTQIYQGYMPAVELTVLLFEVSQTWDDLIDGETLSNDDINDTFVKCLCILPANEMMRLMPELTHHIYNLFLRWRDSTEMENNSPSDDDLNMCYMLRAGFYDIIVLIAAKLYGDQYAKSVGPMVRRFYSEKLEAFKLEFK